MKHYETMARIIRHLDEHFEEQPSLGELASASGLSDHHFHRVFRSLTGVTPKDFLQCLTIERAKRSLRHGDSVLDAALSSGLTGPGRLHDLCVGLEAASPGEIKNGGEGLTLEFGFSNSPFGRCLIGRLPRGLCHLSFQDLDGEPQVDPLLAMDWPNAFFKRNDAMAADMVRRVFQSNGEGGSSSEFKLVARGTPFQLQVWRALLRIPFGRVATYGQLAEAVGNPGAARAVGSAAGANRISMLIPCHRVIRETGVTGGYRWGKGRKRAILAWEAALEMARGHERAES